MTDLSVDIIIPTHNRAHMIDTAVRAALDQSWWNTRVTVIDDGSTDDTQARLARHFDDPRFTYIRLAHNVGTALAKNAGLLLTDGDAVTFHDSDDIPHRDKVLHQARILSQPAIGAHECLNWRMVGQEPGSILQVGAALVQHELVLPDGRRVPIRRDLSLFDDVVPEHADGRAGAGGVDAHQLRPVPAGAAGPQRRLRALHRRGSRVPQPADVQWRDHLDRAGTAADQDRDARQPHPVAGHGL